MSFSKSQILPGVSDPKKILPGVPTPVSAQPVQLNVCNNANNLLSNIGNLNLSNCVDGSCSKHVKSVNKHLTRLQNCANKHSGSANNSQSWVKSFDKLQPMSVESGHKSHGSFHHHGHMNKAKHNNVAAPTKLKSYARPRAF